MTKKLKVYECGSIITGSPSVASLCGGHAVVEREYDDPELECYPVWVPALAESLGVTVNRLSRRALLMWLIDRHPGAVAARLRRIREEFEAGIAPMERLLEERSAH